MSSTATPKSNSARLIAVLAMAAALISASCGYGSNQPSSDQSPIDPAPLAEVKHNKQNAARFLSIATFGPTDDSVAHLKSIGYQNWIDEQLKMQSASHLSYVENRLAQIRLSNPSSIPNATHFYESFWLYSTTSPAQLRERMKLALSEIFVISLADPNIEAAGAASYYDLLGDNAFGNYRTLLKQVTLHPQMGAYLSHLGNQKEDPSTGRLPDENYAREVLQLMSIGTVLLNQDGTVKRDANGLALPSYGSADISNLAKVFTGLGWYSSNPTDNTFLGRNRGPEWNVRQMIFYSKFHSTSSKTFLGTIIPAGSTDGNAELDKALDALFHHPNVGPFMAHRLIQRFVTSNPSPAYIERVAKVFDNNGSGVRGDLAAVTKAILLDPEAMQTGPGPATGKVREPIIRLTNWMRAFGATSATGNFLIGSTSSTASLGQSALTSPSVFNFYRPGYVPPNTRAGAMNLTVPEFQTTNEISVAGYANTMQAVIGSGIGQGSDVKATYVKEVALAHDAEALADRINAMLMYGRMPYSLRRRIVESVDSVKIPGGTATAAQITNARLNRVKIAIYLTMISPDYLVQR